MPLVRFRTNLGSVDAATVNGKTNSELKHMECLVDTEHDVNKAAADWLIERGIAEAAKKPESERAVKGVAKQSEVTTPAKFNEPPKHS